MTMHEPTRLLDGGLVDGAPPSPELIAMLHTLRDEGASPRIASRPRGRWLAIVGVLLALGSTATSSHAASEEGISFSSSSSSSSPSPSPSLPPSLPLSLSPSLPLPFTPASHHRRTPQPAPIASRPPAAAPAAPISLVPSEDYANALSEVARGCCPCALPLLERVVEGETQDPPENVRRAELLLGVCLARTDWPQAAVVVLDEVVRTPAHPYTGEAFGELARLAPRLPDPSVLVDSFRLDDEVRLAGEEPSAATDAAAYLQGRARYDDADFDAAVRAFARVRSGSPFSLPARFYQGTSEVRLRHAQRAVAAFEEVERDGNASRYADLAALALARIHYAIANTRHDAGDDARAAERMQSALEAWRRVPLTSEHFLDAFFEESWALTLAGQDERALGHVFGLLSPFFEDHEHPEAFVVRGTIYFQHCLYDRVDEAVGDFHARYDVTLARLADASARAEDDDVARALHDDSSSLDPVTRAIVRDALIDREVARRIAHEDAARLELSRVASSVHAGHRLGDRLTRELGLAVSFAHARVGDAIRSRLADAHEALAERALAIDTLALETATARREIVVGESTLAEDGLAEEREIIASEGVEYWPFDGEYWQDEVTSYRVVLHDRCGR